MGWCSVWTAETRSSLKPSLVIPACRCVGRSTPRATLLGLSESPASLDVCAHRTTYSNEWFMLLITRAGRQGALTALLDAHRELQALDSAGSVAWARATEEKFHKARRGIPYPSLVLQGFYMPAWVAVVRVGQRTALHGRLLAAELQGQPWPNDTFDTTGATLRSIIRDGRVIAGYSVGDDGVDQGGTDKRDQVFPLYAKP